jgi:hypothetical protein
MAPTKNAEPGAGLPWWQHWVGRNVLFPRFCAKHTPQSALALFQEEKARIFDLTNTPGLAVTCPVKVRGVMGIEESSREWSVQMTVEHLNIVNPAIAALIQCLQANKPFPHPIRIAAVKPKGQQDWLNTLEGFQHLTDQLVDQVKNGPWPETIRHEHPWFGPLTAFQWTCMVAMHQGIHRKQIEAILKGLKA